MAQKGRGAVSSPAGRFATQVVTPDDAEVAEAVGPATEVRPMRARSIVSHNSSPDVPFDRSINPYLGCEHGCVYCYARPTHSYLDLSPGLDFETKIFFKPNAVEKLVEEWQRDSYECEPITIGANTDPYQPAERQLALTRKLLTCFVRHRHPVNLITKSHLVERDLDLLAELAANNLCSVAISIPTMDDNLKRIMEPRVPAARSRLQAMRRLADAGVSVSLLLAPLIPALNDGEIESIVEAATDAGAVSAHYVLLRLPHEVRDLFCDWLEVHFPERAAHVMSLVRQASGGKDYDGRFGNRQTGRGPYAGMLKSRFESACRRNGLTLRRYQQALDCTQFIRPGATQLSLQL